MIISQQMKWEHMKKINKFLLIVFIMTNYAFAYDWFLTKTDSVIVLKDTVIDCDSIEIGLAFVKHNKKEMHYLMGADKQNRNISCPNVSKLKCMLLVSCKNLGITDTALPVDYDSVFTIVREKYKYDFFYKEGKNIEENFYSKDLKEKTNRIFIFDTMFNDTIIRVFLESKYKQDTLIFRDINNDTLYYKKIK